MKRKGKAKLRAEGLQDWQKDGVKRIFAAKLRAEGLQDWQKDGVKRIFAWQMDKGRAANGEKGI